MISKFRRVFRVFRNTHISLRFPKPVDIVQIHNDGNEILAKYVDRSSISVVDPSKLNFWILLKCVFTAKFHMQGYSVEVIKIQRPRVVITFIDNDTNFFLLKQLAPSPSYIAVQNGLRHNYAYAYGDGFVDRLRNAGGKNQLSADVICTFGKSSSALFEDNIRASTLVVGSLKNNLVQVSAPDNLEYDIVFMSQHAPFDLTNREETIYLNDSSISIHEFYEIETAVAKFLAQYCTERSLRFAVSGKRGVEDIFEHQFFAEAIGELPYTFLPRIDMYSSYANGFNSRLVVVVDSTMGYELLSRGRKVAFFSARIIGEPRAVSKDRDTCFGYPNPYSDNGVFWTNNPDTDEYSRILNSLLGMTDAEWATQIQPYTDDLMAYRPGNTEFIQMLKDKGIQVTSEVVHRA
jgi:surface carbohydrate biosynthesis protein